MGAQQLLHIHRQQVAVEHGCWLDVLLRQRDPRQFNRKTASLQNTALHIVHALLEVSMTGVDVGPRVEDSDDGLVDPILWSVAHLDDAGTMAETSEIEGRER